MVLCRVCEGLLGVRSVWGVSDRAGRGWGRAEFCGGVVLVGFGGCLVGGQQSWGRERMFWRAVR